MADSALLPAPVSNSAPAPKVCWFCPACDVGFLAVEVYLLAHEMGVSVTEVWCPNCCRARLERDAAAADKSDTTQALLGEIADARAWLCRWQRLLTILTYAVAQGDSPCCQAELPLARHSLAEAHDRLVRLREELRQRDPHAWRVQEYGLALATEGERAVRLGLRAHTIPEGDSYVL